MGLNRPDPWRLGKEAGDPEALGEYFPTGDERSLGHREGMHLFLISSGDRHVMVRGRWLKFQGFLLRRSLLSEVTGYLSTGTSTAWCSAGRHTVPTATAG